MWAGMAKAPPGSAPKRSLPLFPSRRLLRQVKSKGARRISFEQFLTALAAMASKKVRWLGPHVTALTCCRAGAPRRHAHHVPCAFSARAPSAPPGARARKCGTLPIPPLPCISPLQGMPLEDAARQVLAAGGPIAHATKADSVRLHDDKCARRLRAWGVLGWTRGSSAACGVGPPHAARTAGGTCAAAVRGNGSLTASDAAPHAPPPTPLLC